jgi:hypothetical protein
MQRLKYTTNIEKLSESQKKTEIRTVLQQVLEHIRKDYITTKVLL